MNRRGLIGWAIGIVLSLFGVKASAKEEIASDARWHGQPWLPSIVRLLRNKTVSVTFSDGPNTVSNPPGEYKSYGEFEIRGDIDWPLPDGEFGALQEEAMRIVKVSADQLRWYDGKKYLLRPYAVWDHPSKFDKSRWICWHVDFKEA